MASRSLPRTLGRLYFGVQGAAGIAWWIGVALSDTVRHATLGSLNPVIVGALDIPFFAIASLLVALGMRWAVWIVTPWTLLVTALMVGYATIAGLAGWGAVVMIAASAGSIVASILVVLGRIPGELIIRGPFTFRAAPSASTATHLGKTFAQIAVFWGLFLGVFPIIIAWLENRWGLALLLPDSWRGVTVIAGAMLLSAASALGIWSAVSMARDGRGTPLPAAMATSLVVRGPYRLVRNPMAVSGILQGVAVGLLLGSWLTVAYAIAGSLVWNWVIRPHEERDLEARFGEAFHEYREQVSCWAPRLVIRQGRVARTGSPSIRETQLPR